MSIPVRDCVSLKETWHKKDVNYPSSQGHSDARPRSHISHLRSLSKGIANTDSPVKWGDLARWPLMSQREILIHLPQQLTDWQNTCKAIQDLNHLNSTIIFFFFPSFHTYVLRPGKFFLPVAAHWVSCKALWMLTVQWVGSLPMCFHPVASSLGQALVASCRNHCNCLLIDPPIL